MIDVENQDTYFGLSNDANLESQTETIRQVCAKGGTAVTGAGTAIHHFLYAPCSYILPEILHIIVDEAFQPIAASTICKMGQSMFSCSKLQD
jgi:hypothetical protein